MTQSTKTKIAKSIAKTNGEVFTRDDFSRFGSPSRVTRAIQELLKAGMIVKLGYGVFAKAMPSPIDKAPIPRKPLEALLTEVFESLNIPITQGQAIADYQAGKSDQIPNSLTISTGSRVVTRKIGFGSRQVVYEKNLARTN